eukprot:g41187.t1
MTNLEMCILLGLRMGLKDQGVSRAYQVERGLTESLVKLVLEVHLEFLENRFVAPTLWNKTPPSTKKEPFFKFSSNDSLSFGFPQGPHGYMGDNGIRGEKGEQVCIDLLCNRTMFFFLDSIGCKLDLFFLIMDLEDYLDQLGIKEKKEPRCHKTCC